MKYKKFTALAFVLISYIIFSNLIGIEYEYYGAYYSSSSTNVSGTKEIIRPSHSVEALVKRHRVWFGLVPSYGFRRIGFANGRIILYDPGSLKDYHDYFLMFFISLAIIFVILELINFKFGKKE